MRPNHRDRERGIRAGESISRDERKVVRPAHAKKRQSRTHVSSERSGAIGEVVQSPPLGEGLVPGGAKARELPFIASAVTNWASTGEDGFSVGGDWQQMQVAGVGLESCCSWPPWNDKKTPAGLISVPTCDGRHSTLASHVQHVAAVSIDACGRQPFRSQSA